MQESRGHNEACNSVSYLSLSHSRPNCPKDENLTLFERFFLVETSTRRFHPGTLFLVNEEPFGGAGQERKAEGTWR